MSLNKVASEWLMARRVISDAAIEAGVLVSRADAFAEAVIARLAAHEPPIVLEVLGEDKSYR